MQWRMGVQGLPIRYRFQVLQIFQVHFVVVKMGENRFFFDDLIYAICHHQENDTVRTLVLSFRVSGWPRGP